MSLRCSRCAPISTFCHDASLVDRPADLHAAMKLADALIVRNRTQVDAALIASAPRLKVVGRLGVGLDNIDTAACAARGIEVIAATGANAVSVAEYVVTTAMMLLRGVYSSSAEVAAGRWPRAQLSHGRRASRQDTRADRVRLDRARHCASCAQPWHAGRCARSDGCGR